MKANLDEYVRSNIPAQEAQLLPVIEKELLHYDVLAALDELGLIDKLVFHGGTALRLCYGAQRRSEDLDFAYDGDLDDLRLERLKTRLEKSIGARFDLAIEVKPPAKTVEFTNAKMQRWWLVVNTAPARPDLPSQKLKIEVASVKTLTSNVRRVARNYDFLFPSAGNTLAVCETMSEILSDKLVSFVNTPPTYIRKRDLWDMCWMLSRSECDAETALSFVPEKMAIYGCALGLDEFAAAGCTRVDEVGGSPEFAKDMRRFMPPSAFEEMFGSAMKRAFAINEASNLYRSFSQRASAIGKRGL